MRLLMFYAPAWWYRTAERSLADAPEAEREEAVADAAVVFVHAEARDEDDRAGVVRKFLKNVKWLAGKFGTKSVVLHSFNHLSLSKASAEFALGVMDEVSARLEGSGYAVMRTPFGYFNEFKLHVAGDSLAKVFKEF